MATVRNRFPCSRSSNGPGASAHRRSVTYTAGPVDVGKTIKVKVANGRKTQRSVLLCALAAATVEPDKYGAGEKTLAIVTGENGPETTIITWGPEAEWLPRSELLRHLVQSMLGLTPAEPKVAVLDDDLGS